MTVKLSTGLRNKMLDGGASGGFAGSLGLGKINIYSGPQPLTADAAATGTLLGTVSNGGGATGLTFELSVGGAISKKASEDWKFAGLSDGTAGWGRFYPAGGNPATTSATEARLDFSIASSGADVTLTNISIKTGSPNTIDSFTFTIPAQ